MSFEIPKEVDKLRTELVKQFKDDVVPVRCGNCGAETVMNAMYAKHVTKLNSCAKCR